MTIQWDDAAIPWRNIDSTTNYVFQLQQYNAPLKYETNIMKRILDAKYTEADIKTIAESSTRLDPQERNELCKLLNNYESLFDGNLGKCNGLKSKPITTMNPQSNAIMELIHQTIGNIIRTFDVSNIVNNDPWSGILATTMFSVRATYHTTLQASPMHLVFGQHAILNIKHFDN